jgi:hypothetical protein
LHESEEALPVRARPGEKYPGRKVLLPAVIVRLFCWEVSRPTRSDFLIPAPDWNAVSRINNKRFHETAGKLGIPPRNLLPATIDASSSYQKSPISLTL